jgi:Leucine-rich repeat (LRR) protein
LQKNEFRTIVGLGNILKDVMWNSPNLLWIDLSYNYLESIESEIVTSFPLLKTLYLHGNYFSNLDDVKKLGGLKNLHTLTLYGNPIE